MERLTSYDGLNALVTGASSGIGRLLSLRLAERGARVALVARRHEELEAAAEEIRATGGQAVSLPCDVADKEQALATAAKAEAEMGPIDLLVNNAGFGHHRPFLDWELDDMERLMQVNFFGTLYFTKALLPEMVEREDGVILNPGMDRPIARREIPGDYQLLLAVAPDLRQNRVSWAGDDELLYIEWQATGSIAGRPLSLPAVDRWLLDGGLASEGVASFDSVTLSQALYGDA